MAKETVSVSGKNTFNCKEELKDLGAKWNGDAGCWEAPISKLDDVRVIAAREGLDIDGKPVRNVTADGQLDLSPDTGSDDMAPEPDSFVPPEAAASEKAPAAPAAPEAPKKKTSIINLVKLDPVDAQPRIIKSVHGDLVIREGYVLLDNSNTYVIAGNRQAGTVALKEMAKAAGIQLVQPKWIDVHDAEKHINYLAPNPYIETDKAGRITAVRARAVAVGFTETGKLFFSDRTIYFHLLTHLLQTIEKLVAETPACGEFMTQAAFKERSDDRHKWAFYIKMEGPDEHSVTGTAVDLEHAEIRNALANYGQLLKFAERHAQTKVENMALKNFPGIATGNIADKFNEGGGHVWRKIARVESQSMYLENIIMKLKFGEEVRVVNAEWDTETVDVSDADYEDIIEPSEVVEEDEAPKPKAEKPKVEKIESKKGDDTDAG